MRTKLQQHEIDKYLNDIYKLHQKLIKLSEENKMLRKQLKLLQK